MIKLYGIPLSHNVNKVRYCLDYLKLPYEFVTINVLEGEGQAPHYKAISPTGKIPAIQVDGISIFESNAITRYLARREKSSIYPQDAKKAAAVDSWNDYVSIHVDNALGRVIFNKVLAPMIGQEPDQKSLAFGLEMMGKYLPVIEAQLQANAFLAGPEFSIADINLLAVLDPCAMVGVDLSAYKKITQWRNGLKAQAFSQKASEEREQFMQAFMAGKK